MSGGSAAASPLSARLLSIAEQEGDDGLRLPAHGRQHSAWATWAFAGDPAKTRAHTEAGRLLYDPEKHAFHRFVYGGHDPGACARLLGAWAEWLLGYPEKALASIADSGADGNKVRISARPQCGREFLLGRQQTPTSPTRYDVPEAAIHHLLPVRQFSAISQRAGWRRHFHRTCYTTSRTA